MDLNLNLHSIMRELRPRGSEPDFEGGIATKTTTATTKLFQTSTRNGGNLRRRGTERERERCGILMKIEWEIKSVWNV